MRGALACLLFTSRRVLLAIPTFIGITLLTFAVIDLAVGRRALDEGEGGFGQGSTLSREDRRRLIEHLRLDVPSLLNRDVEDQRRFVERRAAAFAADLGSFLRRLDEVVYGAVARDSSDPLAPRRAAERARRDALRILEELPDPRRASASLSHLPGFLAADRLEGDFEDLARSLAGLGSFGAMTLVHLPGALDRLAPEDPARAILLRLGARLAGRETMDPAELSAVARRRRSVFAPEKIRTWVEAWLRAARDQVEAEAAAARLPDGDPARARALARREEAARGRRSVGRERLGPAGGLAVRPLVEAVWPDESPFVKALAVAWMRKHGGYDGNYEVEGRAGEPVTAGWRENLARTERGFRRHWARRRLRYTEIGDTERWLLYSWTETRYGWWIRNLLDLDFGDSTIYQRPVVDLLRERLPASLALQVPALLLMFVLAVPLGVWAATTRRRWMEGAAGVLLFALYAVPGFWMATMAVLYLGEWLPVHGLLSTETESRLAAGETSVFTLEVLGDYAAHALLPILVLSYAGLTVLARHARSGMAGVLHSDWVRAARALGIPRRRIIWGHALRLAVLPLITLLGGLLPAVVGGSIVVETIFGIPGMGLLTFEAATCGDVPLAMGVVTLVAVLTMVGYLLSDLLTGVMDPRFVRGR